MSPLVALARARLLSIPPFLSGCEVLEVSEGGQTLHCELSSLENLACTFERFSLSSQAIAAAEMSRLARVADELSRRLTYLLEPIAEVESDQEQCVVQMRSAPPAKNESEASYYELLVKRGGTLSLCRYAKSPGAVRRTIPAQVTREVFLRLVDDFSAAAR